MTSSRRPEEANGAGGRAPSRTDLLARRLSVVGEAASLNSRMLRLIQQRAGMEMEELRIELELRRHPGDAGLAAALAEARRRLDAATASQNACAERLDGREREIAEIDRRLATAGTDPRGGQDERA